MYRPEKYNNKTPLFLWFVLIIIILIFFKIIQNAFSQWPYQMATFLFMVFIVILLIIISKSSNNKINTRDLQKRIDLLESSGNIILLDKYINKYKDDYDDFPEEIEKLQKLLERKGVSFSLDEIILLLKTIYNEYAYECFKNRILKYAPNKMDQYVDAFIKLYGEESSDYYDHFYNLIKENKVSTTMNYDSIIELVENRKEEIELEYFENKISNEVEDRITIEDIDIYSGVEFEEYLADLFRKMGYRVETTKISYDQGADLMLNKEGISFVVQAKRSARVVGNHAIQEVVAAIRHYRVDKGIVVTNNEFSAAAKRLAESNKVELIDRVQLIRLIERY